jgi:hypothetical protein
MNLRLQLNSYRNRRAVGSIPTRGPCASFFAAVPDQILKMYIITSITNPNILILIPPSEVQEITSFKSTLSQPAHPITYIYMNLRLQLNSWPL